MSVFLSQFAECAKETVSYLAAMAETQRQVALFVTHLSLLVCSYK